MAVCVFSSLLTVLCVGLYGKYTYAEACTDPVVTPASLLVEYGNPAEVNCSIPSKPETDYTLGWESKTSQPATDTETSVMWKVDSLTNWEEADGLQCFFTVGSNQCESNVTVTIYKRPDRVTLSSVSDVWVEGDQTELWCEIENVGPGHKLSVRWSRADPKHNNAFTQFSETTFPDLVNEMKNVSMTVNLTVTPRREDDGVQYQCAAVLNLEKDPLVFPSQPLNVTVHYKPFITEPLDTKVTVSEGEDLMMNCSAQGNPSPQYKWTSPDHTTISNSSIIISSILKEDQGQYTCTAFNNLDQATRNVTVTVTACTDLVVTPASLLVEYGDPAEVNCSIPSKPETDYTLGWESKTSQPVTDTETSVMWKVDSLTNWEEADGLQCFFTVGSTQCQSNVTVTIYKRPDRVTLSSVPDVWVEGDQTELWCEIENVGPGRNLSVRWSRADPKHNSTFTQFSETTFPDLVNEMKNVSMIVNLTVMPRREDDGVQYQCAAVLNLEKDPLVVSSQPLNVTVHYKPIITGPLDTTVTVSEGEDLMMNCSAQGNPSPQYKWTSPDHTTISNSSIIISSILKKDQGQYTCTAFNGLDQATRNVTVTVTACTDLVVTPASLLVEYGDPAEVNCSIPSKPETDYMLGWESKTSQPVTDTETSVMWKVDSLTNWEEADGLQCYFTVGSTMCESNVTVTIYKRPDRVTLSSVPDVWVEGDQTVLWCEIENVGPGRNLSVRWSRADPKHNSAFTQFSETSFPDLVNEMKNVSKTVKLQVTPRREDDGVQYQCAAVLNLEKDPLVVSSQPLTVNVHSGQLPLISVWGVVGLLLVTTVL
ncbi:vascular cell adhesion protein 1-like isoform X3 [Pangasianodon hypophthalmus]|uniref:vascular cell adhesion protein 1-like isoform X3 n=1 Tax=Pangasianodon hypophthalmus TaxID=310915 RepID=UPI002306FEBE|nr:vascular cell adhesion protein 1-like isoform X3 [Pangasianodon hypophthalmus]